MTMLKCAFLAAVACLLATSAYAQAVSPVPTMQPPPAIAAPPPPPPPAPTMTAPAPSASGYTPPEDLSRASGRGNLGFGSPDGYTPPEDVDAQDPAKQKNPGYSPPED